MLVVTPWGFCLRVIVNEKPLHLEKTTYSVLSVLLIIYGFTGYLNKHGNSEAYTKSSLLRFSVVVPNFILVMSILEYILCIRKKVFLFCKNDIL